MNSTPVQSPTPTTPISSGVNLTTLDITSGGSASTPAAGDLIVLVVEATTVPGNVIGVGDSAGNAASPPGSLGNPWNCAFGTWDSSVPTAGLFYGVGVDGNSVPTTQPVFWIFWRVVLPGESWGATPSVYVNAYAGFTGQMTFLEFNGFTHTPGIDARTGNAGTASAALINVTLNQFTQVPASTNELILMVLGVGSTGITSVTANWLPTSTVFTQYGDAGTMYIASGTAINVSGGNNTRWSWTTSKGNRIALVLSFADLLTVLPSALAATSQILAPTIGIGVNLSPVGATAQIPAPTIGIGLPIPALAATTTLAAPSTVPAVVATPATLAATAQIPTPFIQCVGGVSLSMPPLAATVGLKAARSSPSAAMPTLAGTTQLASPSIPISPPPLAATAQLPAPVIVANCVISESVLAATVGLPVPSTIPTNTIVQKPSASSVPGILVPGNALVGSAPFLGLMEQPVAATVGLKAARESLSAAMPAVAATVGLTVPAISTPPFTGNANVNLSAVAAKVGLRAARSSLSAAMVTLGGKSGLTAPGITHGGISSVNVTVSAVAATTQFQVLTQTDAAINVGPLAATVALPGPGINSTSVGVSIPIVAATTQIQAPNVQGGGESNVSVTVSPVAATAGITAPGIGAGFPANVSLGLVAATTQIPAPAVAASMAAQVGAVGATTQLPAPAITATATTAPGPVGATSGLPSPAPSASATVSPSALLATVHLPAPGLGWSTVVALGPLTATSTVATPSVGSSGNASVGLSPVTATVQIAAPGIGGAAEAIVSVSTVAATTQILSPSTNGQNPTSATPDAIAATIILPDPQISIGAPTSTVAATAQVPAPTITVIVAMAIAPVAATVQLSAPAVVGLIPAPGYAHLTVGPAAWAELTVVPLKEHA